MKPSRARSFKRSGRAVAEHGPRGAPRVARRTLKVDAKPTVFMRASFCDGEAAEHAAASGAEAAEGSSGALTAFSCGGFGGGGGAACGDGCTSSLTCSVASA